MFLINKVSTISECFQFTSSKGCIRTETNSKNNHIYIVRIFICYDAFYLSFTFYCFNSFAKGQLDTVVFQIFSHTVCKIAVIVSCQTCVNNINKDNFFTMTLEGFSQFNTNVTCTNDCYTFDVLWFIVQLINNFLSVLEKFNELKVFKSR